MSFHFPSEFSFTDSQKQLCTELIPVLTSNDIHNFYFSLPNSQNHTIVLNVYPDRRIFINTSPNLDSIKRNLPILLSSPTCSICEERTCRMICDSCTFAYCNFCFVKIWITNNYIFKCPICRTPSRYLQCKYNSKEFLDKISVKLLNLPELNNVHIRTAVSLAINNKK